METNYKSFNFTLLLNNGQKSSEVPGLGQDRKKTP